MKIKELFQQITEKRAESTIDVSGMKPGVQSTAEGLKRTAAEELRGIEAQYKDLVVSDSVIIAVSGEGGSRYAEIATKLGWLAVDFQALTERIAASLKRRSQSEEFTNQEWWMFLDELNQLKVDYGILSLPQPKINHTVDPVYGHPLKKAVDMILKVNYNNSLHSVVVRRVIGEIALTKMFDKDHLPVVLYNCSDVDQAFLPKPISAIVVDQDVGEDEIKEHIDKVSEMVNPEAKKRGRKPKTKGE